MRESGEARSALAPTVWSEHRLLVRSDALTIRRTLGLPAALAVLVAGCAASNRAPNHAEAERASRQNAARESPHANGSPVRAPETLALVSHQFRVPSSRIRPSPGSAVGRTDTNVAAPIVPDLRCVLSPDARLRIVETVKLAPCCTESNVFSIVIHRDGSLYGGTLSRDEFGRNLRRLGHDETRALLTPLFDALEVDARGTSCAATPAKFDVEWRCDIPPGEELLTEPPDPSVFSFEAANCGPHSLASRLRGIVESLETNQFRR